MKTTQVLYGMANPAPPRRSARRRDKWVVTLLCDSKAQADRVERFLKQDRDEIRKKHWRAA